MEIKATSRNGTSFNQENIKELSEKFSRLIKQLGSNNKKDWKKGTESTRYRFEVEFAYAINEIAICPEYLQGKMFDAASGVVNNLINHLKSLKEKAPAAEAVAA